MPYAAESAQVRVLYNNQEMGSWICNRPVGDTASTQSHNFTAMPAGVCTVEVRAYTQPDTQGTLVASGTSTVTLVANQPATETAAISTVAASLAITSDSFTIPAGASQPLQLTARDAQQNVVPLRVGENEEAVEWATNDGEVISLAEQTAVGAYANAVRAGEARITAHFGELSASLDLTVSPPPTASFTFQMPWTIGEIDLPSTWTSVEVTALDSAAHTTTQTIERTGNGTAILEGVTPGEVTVTYAIKDARGETLQSKSGTATVLPDGTSTLSLTSDAFEPIPISLSIATLNGSTSYGYVWWYSMNTRRDEQMVATAHMSNGETLDVSALAAWSSSDSEKIVISSTGLASSASMGYSNFGNADVNASYGGIVTNSIRIYNDI